MNSISSINRVKNGKPRFNDTAGLVINYMFDPSSDISSNYVLNRVDGTYDLSLNNGATIELISGKKCLNLNNNLLKNVNTLCPYAIVSDNTKYINSTTTYTAVSFSYWIYHRSLTPSNSNHMSFGDSLTFLTGFNYANTGRSKIGVNGVGSSSASTVFALNTWYHCVFVIVENTSATLYVNGVSNITYSNATIPINVNRTNPLSLGVSMQWKSDPGIYGYIANFRMYNKQLTANDVSGLYALGVL